MLKFLFSIVLLVLVLDGVASKGLPSYLKLCKRTDPKLEKCITDNIKILRPRLKDGIPELNVPSLNPLKIPKATLDNENSLTVKLQDIEIYNGENFEVQYFALDLDKLHADIKYSFPSLRIKGLYNLHGKLVILNLDGQGIVDGNYTNFDGKLTLKGSHFEKHNKKFIRWEREASDIKIEKVHLYFGNLFGDKKELNDQTNKVINENVNVLIEDLKPVASQVIGDFFAGIISGLFERYPETELFPSS